MNPLTNVKNITKLNEIELSKGTTDKKSWHDIYKGSAWIFIGGLAYGLTEGDVLAVFSQYGEIVNINLVRDKKTGKTKGFCFLCYANQKSTVLAVDNFNGIKLLNRTIRVDHVSNYKPPKDNEHDDELTKQLKSEGCAPKLINHETSPVLVASSSKKKKSKKEKKKHKKDKKEQDDKSLHKKSKIKKEKHDPGYDKYELPQNSAQQSNKLKKSRHRESESSTSGESSVESFVNDKAQSKEKNYEKKIEKSRSRSPANDFDAYNKGGGDKYSSSRKRNVKESESDSDDDYVKQKKSKLFHSKDGNRISPEVRHTKHKSQHRRKSDSSECSSPNDNKRRNVRKVSNYEQHNTSHSSSSKNTYIIEDRRKDNVHQRRSRSRSEEIHHSNSGSSKSYSSKHNQSRESDLKNHSRYESSQCKDYDYKDLRNNRNDRAYSSDHSNIDDYGDHSSTRDHRNTDIRSRKNNNPGDFRNNDTKSSRLNYNEQNHPMKYSEQKDRRSYDYKDGENSNRDSSKYTRSIQNIKSSSIEREKKHSKHRDREDNGKDWYDRGKR